MKKIIVLLVCLYGISAYSQPFMLDQIVGIVGSKNIKISDVEAAYLEARRMGYPMRGDMKCVMFEQLLTRKLLANQAEVDSLVVEQSEVEMDLNRRLEHYQRQGIMQEDLENFFKKTIYEIKDDLRSRLYEERLADKMQNNIVENVKITPSEVRSFYNRLPKDSIPSINGQVEVAQIVMYPPFNDEAINYVRQELLDLRKRIIEGERFQTLAVLYSECPSAAKGGELGLSGKSGLDPEFVKAAWALKNKGDVSRIVVSEFGYHIIQLIERKGDLVNCRHILKTPKHSPEAIKTVTNRLDSIARLLRKDSIKWNIATLRYSQDENTVFNGGLMINHDEQSPLFQSTKFEMTQFSKADYDVITNLKIGEISAPYESRDEKNRVVYKIIKLNDQTDPHRANLKEDYDFLQNLALNEKYLKVINDWVEEKIESSYIYIDDSYKRCGLSNNWLKQ